MMVVVFLSTIKDMLCVTESATPLDLRNVQAYHVFLGS
jgi:hypothetical protein